ncbi:TPA: single-stranded DNA-binding protein [Mannheimia haemolytica]|uniref:Single-stranded DNA-binding protein n=1 Tax=Mannheimia phage vB_MhM_1127AP1 TaxID=1572746 RepID=A0A0M3LP18_9CAUD|nr:single-stranded DNA-binding protein [Mannheimia haemolytica]YP_009785030.1 single strand DNA binding protein [Mannheimia phage vB_MhM_1127AP1]AJA73097.1 single-stranded DNA-binding protein [Mannheimia phage vB_MhM_1127AP1]EEY12897.1 single-stranded DNA binding protein [Mannheimia haemolytica serotype A2 str. BOVINE]QEB85274.1 single-stranded DNA-binding protein [Mannheimia haemolytica]QEB87698.1 single-stranded DNA-binding protein [Mannheimia haemolytica]QEC31663.1 single-stranded DNA-bind
MNLVTLIGRLGQDPDVRVMQNSEKVAALSIATTEKWTDKQTGVKKESTEWHRVVLYRRLAEIAELYVKKGHLVSIIGKIKTRKWTDSNGVERSITEIIAEQMQMLSSGEKNTPNKAENKPQPKQKNQDVMTADEQKDIPQFDDDMPF